MNIQNLSIFDRFLKRTVWHTIGGIILLSILYSVLRYVLFDPKNVSNIPVFVTNKGLSMAAVFCLLGAVLRLKRSPDSAAKYAAAAGFLILIHIPMSLVLLRPGYFPEFFTTLGDRMTSIGELIVMAGAIGAAIFSKIRFREIGCPKSARILICLFTLLLLHLVAMGLSRGIVIDAKHAYLPPMWLLSILAVGGALFGVIGFINSSDSDD